MVSERTRARLILGGAILVVMLSLAAAWAAGSSPRACAGCHTRPAAGAASTAHRSVSCYGCHLAAGAWSAPGFKLLEVTRMYPRGLTGSGVDPMAGVQTARAACLRCHADVLRGVTSAGGLRIAHATCAPGATCDRCHSTVGHGAAARRATLPDMDDCIACHRTSKAPTDCEACHAAKITTERLGKGPWRITHGPDWRRTHGMGRLEGCSACHPASKCVSCHKVEVPHPADFGGTHGTFAVADRSSCLTCHKSEAFCSSCHQIEMPHPAGFLKQHGRMGKKTTDPACTRCHSADDCDRCHAYHIHPGGANGTPRAPAVKP